MAADLSAGRAEQLSALRDELTKRGLDAWAAPDLDRLFVRHASSAPLWPSLGLTARLAPAGRPEGWWLVRLLPDVGEIYLHPLNNLAAAAAAVTRLAADQLQACDALDVLRMRLIAAGYVVGLVSTDPDYDLSIEVAVPHTQPSTIRAIWVASYQGERHFCWRHLLSPLCPLRDVDTAAELVIRLLGSPGIPTAAPSACRSSARGTRR